MEKKKKEWYQTCWGIGFIILFFLPVAIWWIWAKSKWTPQVKWIITGAIAVFFIIGVVADSISTPPPTTTKPVTTKTTTPANNNQPVVTQPKTEEPKKEKTIIDKVWEALDSSIKTRDKYDIQYIEADKLVRVTKEPYDSWDETAFVKDTYGDFVDYGLVAFQIDGVDSIEFLYWANITDQYGKTNKEKGVDIAMKKSEFQKYDWNGLKGQNIYYQMTTSCYEHYIHPAVMKNVKTDKLWLPTI